MKNIFIEGIQGTGKTTLLRLLGQQLPDYHVYWEGDYCPVELAWCREAKRTLRAAKSDVFGELTLEQQKTVREILENLCMYDEHTFGSWQSVSNPYSFANKSQAAEKNIYVYRALDSAQCLLADRARAVTHSERNTIVLFNPTDTPLTAMQDLPRNCLRGDYRSVRCEQTGEQWALEYVDGISNFSRPKDPTEFSAENVARTFSDCCEKQTVRFGPVCIPANDCLRLTLSEEEVVQQQIPALPEPAIIFDANGWPMRVQFADQKCPVIDGTFGEIVSVQADGFSPRWNFIDMFEDDDEEKRAAMRRELLHEIEAAYGKTICKKEGSFLRFEQEVTHSSLRYAKRILTVDFLQKKVDLEVRADR